MTRTERDRFQSMFRKIDIDDDGAIDQVDFDLLVQRVLLQVRAYPGSPEWRRVTDLGNKAWQTLRSGADEDGNGQITAREFVTAYRRPRFADEVAIPFELALLEAADADSDGRLSLTEWLTCQETMGLTTLEALQEFQQIDTDGDAFLTREEYTQYVKQAYTPQ